MVMGLPLLLLLLLLLEVMAAAEGGRRGRRGWGGGARRVVGGGQSRVHGKEGDHGDERRGGRRRVMETGRKEGGASSRCWLSWEEKERKKSKI